MMVSEDNNGIQSDVQQPVAQSQMQQQQPSAQKTNAESTSLPKHKSYTQVIFGVIAVLVVLTIIILYVHAPLSTPNYPTTIAGYSSKSSTTISIASTTIPPIQQNRTLYTKKLSAISSFMDTFNITIHHNNMYYVIAPQFIPIRECNFSGYVKWYIENGFSSNPNAPENYSALNQSIPFSYYYIIGFSNTTAIYSNVIAKNGGYCSNLSKNLSSNSTFVRYNATFYNNAKGYVLVFTNFTAQGFNMTDSYYIGKKPDIAFYYTNVLYNNTRFTVGVWGFRNQINISSVEEMTNSILKAYIG